MGYLAKMAWRNLSRHSGRTLLSLLAIAMGVFVVVAAKGLIDGMINSWFTYNINLNSGHVRVIQPSYKLKERMLPLSYPVGNELVSADDLLDSIRQIPDVSSAVGRIRFGMILAKPGSMGEYASVMGIGTEFDEEEKASRISRFLQGKGAAGRLPAAGERQILLGIDLMARLRVEVGDMVDALFATSAGVPVRAEFRVAGKMESGLKLIDDSSAYVPLDVAAEMLGMEHAVTEIVVFGKRPQAAADLAAKVAKVAKVVGSTSRLVELEAIPWTHHSELLLWMIRAKAIYYIIYALMVTLASFVVFNTLFMVVSERTREIGMLSALGLAPAAIRRLFMIEGGILAVVGSAIGALLGGVFNLGFSRIGFSLGEMTKGVSSEFLITSRIYPVTSLGVMAFAFLLGIAVTMVAVYVPATSAGRLKPTEALRTA